MSSKKTITRSNADGVYTQIIGRIERDDKISMAFVRFLLAVYTDDYKVVLKTWFDTEDEQWGHFHSTYYTLTLGSTDVIFSSSNIFMNHISLE